MTRSNGSNLHSERQQAERVQQQEQAAVDDEASPVPGLVVFDLDACLWLPEMYQLDAPPSGWDEQAAGVRAGKQVRCRLHPTFCPSLLHFTASPPLQVVRLFHGALHAFKVLAEEPGFRDTRVAFASSTTRPSFADAVMQAYRLPDGSVLASRVTVAEMYPIHHKKAHFAKIREKTGVQFNRMLFFDDCNWSDNVGEVMAACPGVVGMRTPDGMTVAKWEAGLRAFAQAARQARTPTA